MRGTVAKKIRKILFDMQTRKEVEVGNEHRISSRGQIMIFGAHRVYIGLKRQHREWRGFKQPRAQPVSRAALLEKRRETARENKRYARQRRRTREREALEDQRIREAMLRTWTCLCNYMASGPICLRCGTAFVS